MPTAEHLAQALGGRRTGNRWWARCPAHDDHNPSLSVQNSNNGKVLVKCFAGCSQTQVIAALRSRGLWGKRYDYSSHQIPRHSITSCDSVKFNAAFAIWQESTTISGTLAEVYFTSRNLLLPPTPDLRFHPQLSHPTGRNWPGMVALVTQSITGEAIGIHRTFILPNGRGKAPLNPAKMMLGRCRGGVVRLAEPGEELMVGEGIETYLAAMQGTGKPAWAALSTSGLRMLDLPSTITKVIVLADGDDPGESAAQNCAQRWAREGRQVRIARPPRGLDFNDLLLGSAP